MIARASKTVAAFGAVTATATAMTVGVTPPTVHHTAPLNADVDLTAAMSVFPPPGQIHDVTGGLGDRLELVGNLIGKVALSLLPQLLGGLDLDL
jgi:hypothetical protein